MYRHAVAILVLLVACVGAPTPANDAGDAGCPVNGGRACACADGRSGVQICGYAGDWAPCFCAGPDAASGPDDASAPGDVPPSCDLGHHFCASAGRCVDLASDPSNCGLCGHACGPGFACTQGTCTSPCPGGGTLCDTGTCVNLQTDVANCGACGNACPSGARCTAGTCVSRCTAGTVSCPGDSNCRDLSRDLWNCGACGHACASRTVCVGATCTPISCRADQAWCAGACADLQTDAANCGYCGHACNSGGSCVAGVCRYFCAGGEYCGPAVPGTCVDTSSDPAHCGGCDHQCSVTAASSNPCVAGSCVPVCRAGLGTCPGTAGQCSTNLRSDDANCGACGHACAVGTSCFDGACLATAVRSIAPLSGLVLNSRRPLFRWSRASGVEGVQIEICADRPCATVEHAETVAADSLRLADALAPGVHFWRLHAVRAGVVDATVGPTWEFVLGASDTAAPAASATLADYNGDGIEDSCSSAPFAEHIPPDYVWEYAGAMITVHFGAAPGHSAPPDRAYPVTAYGHVVPAGGCRGAAGDVDGDGFVDLLAWIDAISWASSPQWVLLHGSADGIAPPTSLPVGTAASPLAVRDRNGDGYADVVFNEGFATNLVDEVFGARSGSLRLETAFSVDHIVNDAADFDGDGLSDLAFRGSTAPPYPIAPVVSYGAPDASLLRTTALPRCTAWTGAAIGAESIADTDGDGYSDLVASDGTHTVTYLGGPGGLRDDRCTVR